MPERFGNGNMIYKNFNRWSEQWVWARVLEKTQVLPAAVREPRLGRLDRLHDRACASVRRASPRPSTGLSARPELSILLKRGRLSTLRGRGLSIQLRAPARVYPEPTLARPLP